MKRWKITGHCPTCGAPIWWDRKEAGKTHAETAVPTTHYSCSCRVMLKLQSPVGTYVAPTAAPPFQFPTTCSATEVAFPHRLYPERYPVSGVR